jgi:hypothetical protein
MNNDYRANQTIGQGYAAGGANAPRPQRQTDESFTAIAGAFEHILDLASRVEGAAHRMGAPLKGESPAPGTAANPQPDTLIWRLQATLQTLQAIESRLSNAVNAIESVV